MLLLDEPTAGLDAEGKREAVEVIKGFVEGRLWDVWDDSGEREMGTVVVATHDRMVREGCGNVIQLG